MTKGLWVMAMLVCGSACRVNTGCASACETVWSTESCGFGAGLRDPDTSEADCASECRSAFRRGGELDGYDPFDFDSVDRSQQFELQNRAQAQAWVGCVETSTCEDINDGFCPGGGVN